MGILNLFRREQPVDELTAAKARGFAFYDNLRRDAAQTYPTSPLARLIEEMHASAPKVQTTATDGKTVSMTAMDNADIKGLDGWFNQPNLPNALVDWYALQSFIGWQTSAIVAQNPLIDKCCRIPARDSVRKGWKVSLKGLPDGVDDAPIIEDIVRADKRLKIKKNLEEYIHQGRVFGVRHVLFHFDDLQPDYQKNPFNPDLITPFSYKGISQVDPYWLTPLLSGKDASDPSSMHFYEPEWWNISGTLYHRSQMCIFRNSMLSDILKPVYNYGGIPVPQLIMERLYGADRTANEAPQLAMSKRIGIWKADLEDIIANPCKFQDTMRNWVYNRDNFGIKVINGNTGEDFTQVDTSLADLDTVIMTQYQLVASLANIPATKLLGTAPKGFDATGEYDESNYHEELESIQENDLTPFLDRHYVLLLRSEIAPKYNLDPSEVEIVTSWEPLDSVTAKEQAEINEIKSRTDINLVNIGALDSLDVRNRLKNDPDSAYTGLADPEDFEQEAMLEKSLLTTSSSRGRTGGI